MKNSYFTSVEITDTHVKLLQTQLERDKVTLYYCDVREITQQSDQEVSKILSSMVTASKIRPINLVGIIPRRFAILRHMAFPSHTEHEIQKMVNLQIVKQVPYPKEDILLDYSLLLKEPSGYSKVLVVAVHKEVADRYLKIFHAANLSPSQLTLSSVGLLHWYIFEEKFFKEKNNRPVVVINIDAVNAEICFCHHQKLLFSRNLNFGARDLSEEKIAAFIEQVGLTIATYAKEKIGEDIAEIIFVGALRDAHVLKTRLEAEYKLPVKFFRSLEHVTVKKDIKMLDLDRLGISLAVALGLMTGLETFVNLMPIEVSGKREMKAKRQEFLRLLFFIGLIMILVGFIFAIRIYKQEFYLRQIEQKNTEIVERVNIIKEKVKRLDFMNGRMSPKVTVIDIVRELYQLTPPDVSFNLISIDENNVLTLQGVSETGSGVNLFQKNLANSPFFQDVNLQYVTKRKIFKGELTDFKMTCQIAKKEKKVK